MPTDCYIKLWPPGKSSCCTLFLPKYEWIMKKEVVEDCGNDLFKYAETDQDNKCISFEDCLSLGKKIIKGGACLPKNDCEDFIYIQNVFILVK